MWYLILIWALSMLVVALYFAITEVPVTDTNMVVVALPLFNTIYAIYVVFSGKIFKRLWDKEEIKQLFK